MYGKSRNSSIRFFLEDGNVVAAGCLYNNTIYGEDETWIEPLSNRSEPARRPIVLWRPRVKREDKSEEVEPPKVNRNAFKKGFMLFIYVCICMYTALYVLSHKEAIGRSSTLVLML